MEASSNLRTTTTSFSNIDLVTCLGDRFREHLPSTRLPDSDLPVGRHFASSGHITQDMLVSVIRSVFRDATDRRSFEARMIFRHRTLHPDGLNVDFGFI